MTTLIDIRLLGRGAHSGIPVFTREITERLIQADGETFELFYPGLRKQKLPTGWTTRPNVSVLNWNIPNKLLDASHKWLSRPDISRHTSADIIFSPHLNNLIKGRLPRVLTIHDLSFAHHPDFFSLRQKSWHYLQNWQRQIKEADHLIAVSHYTKEDIIKTLSVRPEKISVVYPGISADFHPLDPHDTALLQFQKRHQIQTPYFLYLGAIEARKNIVQLIRAFDLLRTNPNFKGYNLVIAGTPGYRAGEVVQAIATAQSKNAIRILSRIADEERVLLYNGAVALVCTSLFEGFGFPTLEAQASGVPVIASNRTSFIETVGTSARLVNPWKYTELADALIELASSEQTRSELITAGLINAKRFSWKTAAHQVHVILEKTHRAFYG